MFTSSLITPILSVYQPVGKRKWKEHYFKNLHWHNINEMPILIYNNADLKTCQCHYELGFMTLKFCRPDLLVVSEFSSASIYGMRDVIILLAIALSISSMA